MTEAKPVTPELERHLVEARIQLQEIKKSLRLFGLDFDGTVSDKTHPLPGVLALVEKMFKAEKSVAFITARAASAVKMLVPPIQELLNRENFSTSCYVAGANGTTLYEVKKDALVEVYNHGFNLEQVKEAVAAGQRTYQELGVKNGDLAEKGLETFRKFLAESWEGFIPEEFIAVCRPHSGEFFTEQAKVTFVLPKDKTMHTKIIAELTKNLGDTFRAALGDETYVHITRKLEEDGKLVAIKNIMRKLGLDDKQVATFGDMPHGNDAGLLSLAYSFTNSDEFAQNKSEVSAPPYILPGLELSSVDRVYKAIETLVF